jgi:hypothetical protein
MLLYRLQEPVGYIESLSIDTSPHPISVSPSHIAHEGMNVATIEGKHPTVAKAGEARPVRGSTRASRHVST